MTELTARDFRAGMELCVSPKSGGANFKVTVMVDGGWQRERIQTPDSIRWVDEKGTPHHFNHTGRRGRYIAVAWQSVADAAYPMFISKTQIVRTWAEEMERRKVQAIEKQKREDAVTQQRKVLREQLEVIRIALNLPGDARQFDVPDGSVAGVGWAFQYEASHIVFRRKTIEQLVALLSTSDKVKAETTQVLTKALAEENAALKRRAEIAEEKLSALHFILNDK